MIYALCFRKNTQRAVAEDKLSMQVGNMLLKVSLGGGTANKHGWSLFNQPKTTVTGGVGDYSYTVDIRIRNTSIVSGGELTRQVEDMVSAMTEIGKLSGWDFERTFKLEGMAADAQIETNQSLASDDLTEDVELPREISPFFSEVYDRNAQISLLYAAVTAATESKFANRFHSVLYGPPGCGKTEIYRNMVRMLGEDSVIKMDGPSTTKAGVENFFLNNDDITGPKIFIMEEIEKAEEGALKVMLGILDSRAEVRKTTGNDGTKSKDVRVLCLATVNNLDLFKRIHAGALYSRFSNHLFCPRPSRAVLEKILEREIYKPHTSGNTAWIKPALDYVIDIEGSYDPRRAIAVCLSGRDSLLDGRYQRSQRRMRATLNAAQEIKR